MTNTFIGEVYDNGYCLSFKDDNGRESVIAPKNENGAKAGDKVEVENMSDNPNLPQLVVLRVIVESVKDKVLNLIEGTLIINSRTHGVLVKGDKQEIIINKSNFNGAKSGDLVKVSISNEGGKTEGKVEEIISYKEGIYRETNKNYGFIDIPGERKGVFVKKTSNAGAKTGDKVRYIIKNFGGKDEGYIKEIISSTENQKSHAKEFLGERYKKRADVMEIAIENGARIKFPDEVIEEVNALDGNIEQAEIDKRVDHRDLFTIAMDGPDTKDRDDAISIKKLGDGSSILYVHIADVTHYVKEDSAIDEEALERATSIYFADVVIPMLPERLSNDLCSLNPGVDRLSMTYEVKIDKDGNIDYTNSKIYESIINSNHSITYKEAQEISDGKKGLGDKLHFDGKVSEDLLKLIKSGNSLANLINKNTKDKGELEFDFPETKVKVDEEGKAIGYYAYEKYETNNWIKAFMCAANDLSSEKGSDLPYIYRVHLMPKEEAIEKLKEVLKICEVDFDISTGESHKFVELLKVVKGNPKEKFLEKAILITMQKAVYSIEKQGHFGLAKGNYTHSTSPIRRYSDLIAHRIMKEELGGTLVGDRITDYTNILEKIVEKCNAEEDKAEKIESDVNKFKACEFMEEKIGEKFKGYISGITKAGIFVELENTVQGHVIQKGKINLNDKAEEVFFYEYTELCEGLCEATDLLGNKLNVGDNVKLKLKKVSKKEKKIEFEII